MPLNLTNDGHCHLCLVKLLPGGIVRLPGMTCGCNAGKCIDMEIIMQRNWPDAVSDWFLLLLSQTVVQCEPSLHCILS